jgi:phage shock protein E
MNRAGLVIWCVLLGLGSCNRKSDPVENDQSIAISQSAIIISIDSRDAKVLLDEKEDMILLDVRTAEEYSQGHLAGAQNIDYNDSNFTKQIQQLDPNKKYMVYCAVGGRSGKALKIMEEMGFMEVYNVSEGFKELREQGIPASPFKE